MVIQFLRGHGAVRHKWQQSFLYPPQQLPLIILFLVEADNIGA